MHSTHLLRPAAFAVALGLAVSPGAGAALLDRGGGLLYDTDLDLTLLADANAGAGSAFDDGTNTTDGRMSWASAMAWAASLTVGGVDGWRLPATIVPDAGCTNFPAPTGFNCTGSEMGHLFYVEMDGTANQSIFATGDPAVLALVSNLQVDRYWSSTSDADYPDYAWDFIFSSGSQHETYKTTNFNFAWAVHDGDVAAIPVPATGGLALAALGAALARARRRPRHS